VAGDKDKATEAFRQAVKYALITPRNIWIFSEVKMKLTPPEEFIDGCNDRLKQIEPEVSIGLSTDSQIP
jgi:hypothetical protein